MRSITFAARAPVIGSLVATVAALLLAAWFSTGATLLIALGLGLAVMVVMDVGSAVSRRRREAEKDEPGSTDEDRRRLRKSELIQWLRVLGFNVHDESRLSVTSPETPNWRALIVDDRGHRVDLMDLLQAAGLGLRGVVGASDVEYSAVWVVVTGFVNMHWYVRPNHQLRECGVLAISDTLLADLVAIARLKLTDEVNLRRMLIGRYGLLSPDTEPV